MTLPWLSDIEHLPKVRFPKDNKVRFFMDFASWEGVPDDRDFYLTSEGPTEGYVTMVANGYGVRGDYGNGSIFIKRSDAFAVPHPAPLVPSTHHQTAKD